jgi:hypothetical protein
MAERIARRRQTREAYYAEQEAHAAAKEAVVKAAMAWAKLGTLTCCEDLRDACATLAKLVWK